jgi:hypothetical protein
MVRKLRGDDGESSAADRARAFAADARGQAFTLEGLVGSIVVLTAVLFALQSVVLTPTTAGTVDQDVKAQLHTEANDALTVAAEEGSLQRLALYWNSSSQRFAYSFGQPKGYGTYPPCERGPPGKVVACDSLGELLNGTLTQQGYVYNLYVDYRNATDPRRVETRRVVYRGVPSDSAVTATYTVVLLDGMTLTAPEDAGGRTLGGIAADPDSDFYAPDVSEGPVYNVVEVRIVVW